MLDWSQTEKYYDQGNTAGFALSLLESEKLLREVLTEKKFPGRDVDEKLVLAKNHLSSPQIFDQARSLVKQLLSLNLPKHINQQTAEQILRAYFTAVTELSHVPGSEINKKRLAYLANNSKRKLGKAIFYLIVASALTMAVTAFLADTSWGQNIVVRLQDITRLVLYRALPMFLAVILIILAIMGISLNRRRKKHVQQQP